MPRRILVTLLAIAVVFCLVLYFFNLRVLDYRGVVLARGSNAPIAGARVTLDCQAQTIHGFHTLRTLRANTEADGTYRFARSDLHGCGHFSVTAERHGYLDPWDLRLDGAVIDRPVDRDTQRIWLIDERDAPMLRLEGLLVLTQGDEPSPTPIPDDHYSYIAIPFQKSRAIATTAEQLDWIRANYCDRLAAHWARTPEQSQTKLVQAGDVRDYATDVVGFCKSAGMPAPAT